jgi:hypothetical protein
MTVRTRTTADVDLVKVAYAQHETEAEFLQGLLRDADVGSVVRRAPGFDVPDFLAAGPRHVLSPGPTSPSRKKCCARSSRLRAGHRRGPAPTGRRGCSPHC